MGGNKQQPGTSSHPDLNPARTRPSNPCISNHATLPPPPTLPKTEIALSTQDSNSQHRGTPTHPDPSSPPIKKTQKFPFPEPPGNPCALCVCVPAFSKMSVALFLLVLRPSRTLGCWLGSSRTLPVHPELAPVFHQPQRATHVIRLSGATSERGK